MRILVIEDEVTLCEQIKQFFVDKGFAVDTAHNGQDGYFMGKEYPLDAVIMDLGLPDFSGVEVLKRLRRDKINTPILILTARSSWQEKVEVLDAGANDYIVKPFQYEELLARVNAQIRAAAGKTHPVLTHGTIELNTVAQEVLVAGIAQELTTFEYKVLHYLMLHKGEVISKAVLIEHVYDEDFDRDSNVIEVFILRLRRKLGRNLIETLRGRGYRIPSAE